MLLYILSWDSVVVVSKTCILVSVHFKILYTRRFCVLFYLHDICALIKLVRHCFAYKSAQLLFIFKLSFFKQFFY